MCFNFRPVTTIFFISSRVSRHAVFMYCKYIYTVNEKSEPQKTSVQ